MGKGHREALMAWIGRAVLTPPRLIFLCNSKLFFASIVYVRLPVAAADLCTTHEEDINTPTIRIPTDRTERDGSR